MEYSRPLHEGILLKRYKRFFADIRYNNETLLAHVPNSGSMRGCNAPGSPCRFSHDDNPSRKLKYTLEMVLSNQTWVGVNTSIPNKIVWEAFEEKKIKPWSRFNRGQREVAINKKSRIDFAFWNSKTIEKIKFTELDLKKSKQKFHFVEVKNVSLVENNIAFFPDSVTERGQKHLTELMRLKEWGHTAEIVFTVQRSDCKLFAPADHIDSDYGKLLREAHSTGVIVSPYFVTLLPKSTCLSSNLLPLSL